MSLSLCPSAGIGVSDNVPSHWRRLVKDEAKRSRSEAVGINSGSGDYVSTRYSRLRQQHIAQHSVTRNESELLFILLYLPL